MKNDLKVVVPIFLIAVIFFSSIMIYRANEIDPQLDATYAEIYGLNEEGDEW